MLDPLVRLITMISKLPSLPLFFLYLFITCSSSFYSRYLPKMDLKLVMKVHNILCILISGITFSGFLYGLITIDSVYSRNPASGVLSACFFLYWTTKVLELLDTVFMILRKKGRQISVLHVYHHSSMLLLSDYAYNISPWPCMALPLGLNSFVHIFVYYYYMTSAFSPLKNESWKRALTQLQILQFIVCIVYCSIGYCSHGFCPYSVIFAFSMLAMFANFYWKNYCGQNVLKCNTENGVACSISKKIS